ncbi:MAG TPA: hypothetical protein VHE99_05755 [Gammaproteobacteria bacterium]|nr:hypothetical protein [Gammaproteobacteria bacterium]
MSDKKNHETSQTYAQLASLSKPSLPEFSTTTSKLDQDTLLATTNLDTTSKELKKKSTQLVFEDIDTDIKLETELTSNEDYDLDFDSNFDFDYGLENEAIYKKWVELRKTSEEIDNLEQAEAFEKKTKKYDSFNIKGCLYDEQLEDLIYKLNVFVTKKNSLLKDAFAMAEKILPLLQNHLSRPEIPSQVYHNYALSFLAITQTRITTFHQLALEYHDEFIREPNLTHTHYCEVLHRLVEFTIQSFKDLKLLEKTKELYQHCVIQLLLSNITILHVHNKNIKTLCESKLSLVNRESGRPSFLLLKKNLDNNIQEYYLNILKLIPSYAFEKLSLYLEIVLYLSPQNISKEFNEQTKEAREFHKENKPKRVLDLFKTATDQLDSDFGAAVHNFKITIRFLKHIKPEEIFFNLISPLVAKVQVHIEQLTDRLTFLYKKIHDKGPSKLQLKNDLEKISILSKVLMEIINLVLRLKKTQDYNKIIFCVECCQARVNQIRGCFEQLHGRSNEKFLKSAYESLLKLTRKNQEAMTLFSLAETCMALGNFSAASAACQESITQLHKEHKTKTTEHLDLFNAFKSLNAQLTTLSQIQTSYTQLTKKINLFSAQIDDKLKKLKESKDKPKANSLDFTTSPLRTYQEKLNKLEQSISQYISTHDEIDPAKKLAENIRKTQKDMQDLSDRVAHEKQLLTPTNTPPKPSIPETGTTPTIDNSVPQEPTSLEVPTKTYKYPKKKRSTKPRLNKNNKTERKNKTKNTGSRKKPTADTSLSADNLPSDDVKNQKNSVENTTNVSEEASTSNQESTPPPSLKSTDINSKAILIDDALEKSKNLAPPKESTNPKEDAKADQSLTAESKAPPATIPMRKSIPAEFTEDAIQSVLSPEKKATLIRLITLKNDSDVKKHEINLQLRGSFIISCASVFLMEKLYISSDIDSAFLTSQENLTQFVRIATNKKYGYLIVFQQGNCVGLKHSKDKLSDIQGATPDYVPNYNPFILTRFPMDIQLKDGKLHFALSRNVRKALEFCLLNGIFPAELAPPNRSKNIMHYFPRLIKYTINFKDILNIVFNEQDKDSNKFTRIKPETVFNYFKQYFRDLFAQNDDYYIKHHFSSLIKMIQMGIFATAAATVYLTHLNEAYLLRDKASKDSTPTSLEAAKNTTAILQTYFDRNPTRAPILQQIMRHLSRFNLEVLASETEKARLIDGLEKLFNFSFENLHQKKILFLSSSSNPKIQQPSNNEQTTPQPTNQELILG